LPVVNAGAAYRIVTFGLTLLGGSLGAGSVPWSKAFGLATVAAAAFYVVRFWRRRGEWSDVVSVLGGVFTFGALSCFMISVGRSAMRSPALESRYIAYSEFAVIAVYLCAVIVWQKISSVERHPFKADRRIEYAFVVSVALVVTGLVASNAFGFYAAKQWHIMIYRNKVLIQNFERAPAETLRGIYFVDELHRILPRLRQERLGPFADAPDVLLPMMGAVPSPLREITADESISQEFISPIDSIDDVDLFFATWGERKNTCELELTIKVDGREVERQVLACSTLSDKSWTRVEMQRPLRRSLGRRITVSLAPLRAIPGESVTVWTFPAYYGGVLTQKGATITGRNLALSLNAFKYGLHL
jgi:hypothetical protein